MPGPETAAAPLEIALRVRGAAGMGSGRAAMLEAIAATGSISAAAREVGLSYRKAWRLVDEMNQAFREPLVETAFGGARGGGARLTGTGRAVLDLFRRMEAAAAAATRDDLGRLSALLAG